MKKNWLVAVLFALILLSGCATHRSTPATTVEASAFVHDPRLDSRAMEDIKVDPSAVYGFSPRKDSERLGAYASYDWSDPDFVSKAREERIAYHQEMEGLYAELAILQAEGNDIETCARTISAMRNQARLNSYTTPEGLETVKKSNLKKYGNELGPTPESLYEKYGSWEIVLQKAFSSNHGMDACLGLYDEQYENYVLLGEI